MAQFILNVEPYEILRAFTTGAKRKNSVCCSERGSKPYPTGSPQSSPEQGGMGVQGERTDSRYNVRRMSQANSP